jgi:hypothetical protein
MCLEEHWQQALASSISFGSVRRELVSSMLKPDPLFSFILCLLVVALNPFLAVADLMGEGRVDLNVGFTFSIAFSGFSWQTRELLFLLLLG